MKNNSLIFLVFIFSSLNVFSQTGSITGNIEDKKSNEPVYNVKILIKNSDTQTFSDNNGVFKFKFGS